MKNSIVDKIEKAINDNEANAIDTLKVIKELIASERKPDFTQIKDGEHFTYKGRKFIRLGKEQGGILCITAQVWKEIAFDKDDCNNFKKSSVKKLLNSEFLSTLDETDLLPYTVDLTADNGDKAYGTDTVKVGLLSADLYRKYRDFIPLFPEWMWLSTPWYCSGGAFGVRYVLTNGVLANVGANFANGVVPACIFKG